MRGRGRVGCGVLGLVVGFAVTAQAADVLEPGEPANLFVATDAVTGLEQPTSFAFLPDGRMIITEKGGNVILAGRRPTDAAMADGSSLSAFKSTQVIGTFPVNTLSEQGLLHVIVHPGFATNRLLIFYYSAANPPASDGSDVDRNRVVTVPLDASFRLDRSREKILVRGLHGPANHDGGALAIGPDGKLYIGDGDTGCNSNLPPEPVYEPHNYFATCLTIPNGKILRVNLDGSIPSDNPLVGKRVTACGAACGDSVTTLPLSARPRTDIWAWGFRNPWRFWFDPKTKNLWVGDVGEVTYEEIDVIPPSGKGKHYGWPWREGGKGHPTSTCREITPDAGDCVDPQYYCRHGASADGIDGDCESITGGLIVDSCAFPATFRGRYFFADNANSWLATLQPTADRNGIVPGSREMFLTGGSNTLPVHLDVGPDGALYFAEIRPGKTGVIERVYPKHPESCGSGTPDGGKSHDGGNAQSDGSDAAESRIDASVDGGVVPLARPTTGSACGCRIAERASTRTPFVLSLSLVGLMLARRRRRV